MRFDKTVHFILVASYYDMISVSNSKAFNVRFNLIKLGFNPRLNSKFRFNFIFLVRFDFNLF